MPLDPIVSLAVALAEAPGTCACLLGAGVSMDAGVPTAWEIRQDGFRRLYQHENGAEETPSDEQLAEWLRGQGHEDLDYSGLLDAVAPDPAMRRAWLGGYFEGAEPGVAHQRLADLAAGLSSRRLQTGGLARWYRSRCTGRTFSKTRSNWTPLADAARASNAPPRDGLDVWLKPWPLPFWIIGMALGSQLVPS